MNKTSGLWLLLYASQLYADQLYVDQLYVDQRYVNQPYRDPFQPLQPASCSRPASSPADWRLKGTIGTADLRYGWVTTSQGHWLGLRPQQSLPDGRWRVMRVQPRQLELGVQGEESLCPPFTGKVVLTLEKSS